MFFRKLFPVLALASLLLAACTSVPAASSGGIKVVASTTIVGDVVRQVGGDLIDLSVLFPIGADPHTFDPRPKDLSAISDAAVIFISGLGLEESLQPALDANAAGTVVSVSDGIDLRGLEGGGGEGSDPHTWTDPNNVIVWTQNIAAALTQADPANADTYQANAESYITSLRDLDAWIRSETEKISPDRRKLVTDHRAFGYFADEYGFEQIGALVGSFSTNASPSAQEIAALEDLIHAQNAPAVFVGVTVNPALAEQVARDTGAKLVFLYTGSLSDPGGGADSYLKFMRYNVGAIVEALK